MTIRKKIGKNTIAFAFEGNSLWECQMQAEKLSFGNLSKCGLCQSENIYLNAYKTQDGGYQYTVIRCGDCKGKLTFGERKDDGSVYFRKNEDGSYKWERPPAQNTQEKGNAKGTPTSEGDLSQQQEEVEW